MYSVHLLVGPMVPSRCVEAIIATNGTQVRWNRPNILTAAGRDIETSGMEMRRKNARKNKKQNVIVK